eukprot:scaffold155694_cov21-Tisochrysis_lutea.AAC.2
MIEANVQLFTRCYGHSANKDQICMCAQMHVAGPCMEEWPHIHAQVWKISLAQLQKLTSVRAWKRGMMRALDAHHAHACMQSEKHPDATTDVPNAFAQNSGLMSSWCQASVTPWSNTWKPCISLGTVYLTRKANRGNSHLEPPAKPGLHHGSVPGQRAQVQSQVSSLQKRLKVLQKAHFALHCLILVFRGGVSQHGSA